MVPAGDRSDQRGPRRGLGLVSGDGALHAGQGQRRRGCPVVDAGHVNGLGTGERCPVTGRCEPAPGEKDSRGVDDDSHQPEGDHDVAQGEQQDGALLATGSAPAARPNQPPHRVSRKASTDTT